MSIFEVCKCQCIYLVNKTACVFSLMRNDPRTTIMRVHESLLETFLLRRSQEMAANRDTNILAEYLLDWQVPAVSRRNIITLVRPLFRLGNSSNTFDVFPGEAHWCISRVIANFHLRESLLLEFISVSSLIPNGNVQCSLNAFSFSARHTFHRANSFY